MYDFEDINRILAELAEDGTLEPMVEPCDESDSHPLDWADAVNLFDEVCAILYPEA